MTQGLVLGPRFVSAVLLLWGLAHGSSVRPLASAPPAPVRSTESSPASAVDLFVPGGVARLFRAAGLRPPRDRAYALFTLSRLVYQEPLGGSREDDASAARLREYLDVLGQWSMRAAPFSTGIVLKDAAAHATRGRLEDLLAFLGLALRDGSSGRLVERRGDADAPRRRALLSTAGFDVDAFEKTLNAGARADVGIPGDTVPLPLAPATWLRTIFENRVPAEALFALLIGEREALWLYCGLLALDGETRAFFENQPDLLAWVHRNRPALFGAFGRGIRIRAGRVLTPGGARDVPLWESLAGGPVNEPARFVRGLMERDGGRLAWFYDTVSHLPPERQAVLAGVRAKDGADRLTAFRSIYSVFLGFQPAWDVSARPFVRRALDPTVALHVIEVTPEGLVAGPRWRSFWEHAFTNEGLPDRTPEAFTHLESDLPATISWVLGKIFTAPLTEQRPLFDLLLFAGRLFPPTDRSHLFEALVALRGFSRFPAMMLVLEHAGVREPTVYADAARAAAVVGAPPGGRALVVRTVQFQAALALLDRLREVHALDAPAVTTLARTLFAARPASDGWYRGAIVGWIDRELLPALGIGGQGGEAAEGRVMMALAGMPRVPGQTGPTVVWAGQRYRVDLAQFLLGRLIEVRGKQGGSDLDEILNAWRAAATETAPPDAGSSGQSSIAGGLHAGETSTLLGSPVPISEPAIRMVDWATAEWLASLAYAVRIEGVDAPLLLVANPALTHDLRLLMPRRGESSETAWSIAAPAKGSEERVHLAGSLLGLAVPLSRYSVTRLETGMPPHPPTVHSTDGALLMASVSSFNPRDVTDDERDRIADGIRRGRARLSALGDSEENWTSIADDLSADEWERQLIPWMVTHERDRLSARFSAHDLFVLGGGKPEGAAGWGMLGRPIDGSLLPRLPTPDLRRVLANQAGVGALFTQFCDVHFRVAEFLAGARLPASLGRGVLALAVPHVLDHALLSHDSDWPGFVAAAGALTDEQLATYVSTMTVGGLLVRSSVALSPALDGPRGPRFTGWCP